MYKNSTLIHFKQFVVCNYTLDSKPAWWWAMLFTHWVYIKTAMTSQITKAVGSISIRHPSDVKVSGRCLIEVDLRVLLSDMDTLPAPPTLVRGTRRSPEDSPNKEPVMWLMWQHYSVPTVCKFQYNISKLTNNFRMYHILKCGFTGYRWDL